MLGRAVVFVVPQVPVPLDDVQELVRQVVLARAGALHQHRGPDRRRRHWDLRHDLRDSN